MSGDDFCIRAMKKEEVALMLDWAAGEGWNPGLADAVYVHVRLDMSAGRRASPWRSPSNG